MADTKITGLLSPQVTTNPATDVLPIVNIADTLMASSGSTRKITVNQLLGAGGTATLASATITGDLTVNTNVLKVDSTNNRVGIGTASPLYALDVRGAIAGGNGTIFGGVTFSSRTEIGALSNHDVGIIANSVTQYLISTGGNHTWFNGGSTAMTLNSTGLGVGVASPSYKLDVQGADNSIIAQFGGAGGRKVNFTTSANGGFANGFFNFVSTSSVGAFSFQNTNGTLLTIDNGGNVGVGVTPSAWGSGKAIEVLEKGYGIWNGSGSSYLLANAYFNSGFKYANTGSQATHYYQYQGTHVWSTAASGTAGNAITFTQAMTLDASGNLILLSSNTPATLATNGQLTVNATSNTNLRFSYRGSDGTTRVANITLA
jgi:hypothetical protein